MRHTTSSGGFVICWLLNLLLNWHMGAVALVLWTISLWLQVSWYPAAVVLGLWLLITFGYTAFFCWLAGSGNNIKPEEEKPNINPYSAHTEDYLQDKH